MTKISTATILVFDTETTGVDVLNDRIVEFGAVWVEQGQIKPAHHAYFNPGIPIPPEATEVHGITDEKVANGGLFPGSFRIDRTGKLSMDGVQRRVPGNAVMRFEAPVLCGYNAASFDAPLLNAEFERHGFATRLDPKLVLDPVVFVRWHLRGERGRKLGDMCVRFGVTLENAHTAVADSTATAQLLLKMIETGFIPDDLDEALEQQARYAAIQEVEFRLWSYWLYVSREAKAFPELRIGAGKHCGKLLRSVDTGFLEWILKLNDLAPGARRVFRLELGRRLGEKPSVRWFLGGSETV